MVRKSGPYPKPGAVTGAPRAVARVRPRDRTPLALTVAQAFGDGGRRGKLVSERRPRALSLRLGRGRGGRRHPSAAALRRWPLRRGCWLRPWQLLDLSRRRRARRRRRRAPGRRRSAAYPIAFCSSAANCCRRASRFCRLPISSARAASRRLLQPSAFARAGRKASRCGRGSRARSNPAGSGL